MTYDEFIKRKEALGLSFSKFAMIVGHTPDAIKKWKKGKVPQWAEIVIKYLEIKQTMDR